MLRRIAVGIVMFTMLQFVVMEQASAFGRHCHRRGGCRPPRTTHQVTCTAVCNGGGNHVVTGGAYSTHYDAMTSARSAAAQACGGAMNLMYVTNCSCTAGDRSGGRSCGHSHRHRCFGRRCR